MQTKITKSQGWLVKAALIIFIGFMGIILLSQAVMYSELIYIKPTTALMSTEDISFYQLPLSRSAIINIITTLISIVAFVLINKFDWRKLNSKKIAPKKIKHGFYALTAAFILGLLLLSVATGVPTKFVSDNDLIYSAVASLRATGEINNIGYYQMYPYNLSLVFIFSICDRLLSIFTGDASTLSVIAVSVLVYLFTLYKMFKLMVKDNSDNPMLSLVVYGGYLLFLPTTNYIVYTYNYSLGAIAFLLAFIYIFKKEYTVKVLTIASVIFAIDGLIRSTNLIIAIAFVIAAILYERNLKNLWKLLIVPVVIMIIMVGGNKGLAAMYNVDTTSYKFPVNHWLVLGSEEETVGTYSVDIKKRTQAMVAQNGIDYAKKYNNAVLIKEYSERGVLGNLKFWMQKFKIMWGVGDFNVHHNLLAVVDKGKSTDFANSASYRGLIAMMTIFVNVIYMMAIQVAWRMLKDPLAPANREYLIVALTMLGTIIVYMFWETRGRYSYPIMPLFTWMTIYYFMKQQSWTAEKER